MLDFSFSLTSGVEKIRTRNQTLPFGSNYSYFAWRKGEIEKVLSG
jgi:hypothetical protein